MLVVGLTGGMGAGKSTVAQALRDRGACGIDADQIVHGLLRNDVEVLAAVAHRFGYGVIDADGHVDRRALGVVVFGDDQARLDLQALLWPRVEAEVRTRLAEFEQSGCEVAVVELPLLVESGRQRWQLDTVMSVEADADVVQGRLVAQRQLSTDEVTARRAAQASPSDRVAIADVVFDNSGSLDVLLGQVDTWWATLSLDPPSP